MSEKNRERGHEERAEPLTDNCSGCNETYELTTNNSRIYTFDDHPECGFIYAVCPCCDYRTRIHLDSESIQSARNTGLGETITPETPPQIYQGWLDMKGIKLVETHELTPRLEETVRKFGSTVNAILDQDPELFWQEMNDPERPHTMPERWI